MTTPRPSYVDFAIRISQDPSEPTRGVMQLVSSPDGGRCTLPLALPDLGDAWPETLRALEAEIWRSGQPNNPTRDARRAVDTRRPGSEPEGVGAALFGALFRDAMRERLLTSLVKVGTSEAKGLRIRLMLDPTEGSGLSALPWELLYRPETRDFLGRDVRTPVVRHLEVDRAQAAPAAIDRLRILVAIANPKGTGRLDVVRERKLIEAAWGRSPNITVDFLEATTIRALRERFRRQPFDILHFVGHGGFDDTGHGVLLLEGSDSEAVAVSGELLADTLKGFDSVRLVFLNACETARLPRAGDGSDPYRGVASSLVMGGISAVIAMQFPISDRAAIAFSDCFYRALAAGDPLETAVTEARMGILYACPGSSEWATPALFLNLPDGRIFDVVEATAADDATQAADASLAGEEDDLAKALELIDQQRYDEAISTLAVLQERHPDDGRVSYYSALAQLRGRRPRSLRIGEIKHIERDLHRANQLLTEAVPAEILYLQALLKFDFYRFKGLTVRPPSVDELLEEAAHSKIEEAEVHRLLTHAPTPENPVVAALRAHL